LLVGVLVRANPYGVDTQKSIAQIRYRHGIVADADHDWEAAVQHYRDALELDPEYAKCHMNLGVDLWRLGRGDEAMHHLERAEELDPTYYRAPLNRAKVLEELGRRAEALDAYRRAVELEPRYLLARVGLAQLLLERNDRIGAEEQITAIEQYDDRWISPGHELASRQAGVLRAYLGQRDDLRERGIADCWAESELFRRAEVARLRGNPTAALAHLGQYFTEGGRCAEAYRSLGVVLTAVDEPEGARDALERARAAEPELPRVNLGLARLAAAAGEAENALEAIAEEIRIDPEASEPYLEAGLIHDRLRGDAETAQQWFDRYLEKGGSPEVIAGRRAAWRRHLEGAPSTP
jgi:tetratricopeptide (TPR) repeat protein